MGQDNSEDALAKKGRMVALVIAGAMVFWILAQWIGPQLGMPGRFALLIDFAVLAALVWSMIVTYQIWRARQDTKG
ncbi:hypothetical protein LY10_01681 [Planktotalea frisia]|jgi:hypothetical protein|uniref:DUF5337 domain-containing protein n=1 Tax=Planktotalea frisia TaxID=696762 RepID=A0A1L9NYB4_9RHOB|nr:DUF5337 domain-containing protein [Planktotalea frisia]OJI94270.1 hypothetical protein PFRI_15060 [Planktotalea frisia]PZX29960.1 hypothetical protein LY10_01681 [Planktotalea frisia]